MASARVGKHNAHLCVSGCEELGTQHFWKRGLSAERCGHSHPAPFERIRAQMANEAPLVDELIAWEWHSCLSPFGIQAPGSHSGSAAASSGFFTRVVPLGPPKMHGVHVRNFKMHSFPSGPGHTP